MNGNGRYNFSDGDVFEGKLSNGKFVSGTYKYANGQVYSGRNFKLLIHFSNN